MKERISKVGGRRAVAALSAFALLAIIATVVRGGAEAESSVVGSQAKPVIAETVAASSFRPSARYSGFVAGVRQADVTPKTAGYVTRLLKEEGDSVRAGETIAVLDGVELSAMRDGAKGTSEAARKAVREAENYYEQVVDEAEASLRKVEDSYDDGAVGKRDLEIAEEAVKSAKRMRDAQVAEAESALAQAESGRLVADAAARNVTVLAPFSGTVTRRHVSEGSFSAPGMPVYTIASADVPEVSVSVPGHVARGLLRGETVSVSPEGDGETFVGEVFSVAQAVGVTTQTAVVRIRFAGTDAVRAVFLGQYATASIPIDRSREAIFVPASAIVREYEDAFVFIVGDGNRVERRAVRLGETSGDRFEIASGLSSGERVVVEGAYGLADGDAVNAE